MLKLFKSLSHQEILHETNFVGVHDLHEDTQENSPSSNEDDEFQESQEYNPDQDLEPSIDDLLDFISSQEHSAYHIGQYESQTPTRQLNTHITYHVAQAN